MARPGMTSTDSYGDGAGHRRLGRDRVNGMLGGVCAGIADYFGREPWQVRVLVAIGLIFFPPPTLFAYLLAWVLLPVRPVPAWRHGYDDAEWRAATGQPDDSVTRLDERFQSMERRVEAIERTVTSREFRLDREFRNLR